MQEEQRLITRRRSSSINGSIQAKTTNIFFSALSVVNTMVGAGILVLPSATMDMGLLMSNFSLSLVLLVITVVALLNVITSDLLLISAEISGQPSFSDLGYYVLGRSSIFIYGSLICVCFFLFITLYAQIFASAFQSILINTFRVSQLHSISWYILGIIILFLGQFLLILQKQIVEIRIASLLSFIAAISFVLFLAVLLFAGETQYNSSDLQNYIIRQPSYAMIAGIAAFVTAFSYQPVIYAVYLGLSNRSLKRGSSVNYLACLFTFTLYITTSVLGVCAYPSSALSGDILTTLSAQLPHWYRVFPNGLFLVVMAMHIPIMFFVLKQSLLIMIDECMRRSTSNQKLFLEAGQSLEVMTYLSMNPLIYYSATILLWFCSIGLALARISLKSLVNYLGAFGMCIVSFIIPGVYYLLTLRKSKVKGKDSYRCCAWFSIIFGLISMILLISANILVTLGF